MNKNTFQLNPLLIVSFHRGEEPQRVCDPFIGLASSDPLEDVVLLSDRKTEVFVFKFNPKMIVNESIFLLTW